MALHLYRIEGPKDCENISAQSGLEALEYFNKFRRREERATTANIQVIVGPDRNGKFLLCKYEGPTE